MYNVYVKDEAGRYYIVEKNIRVEEIQSKIDEYIKQGYEEVIVLNDLNYVMSKIREKAKVLRK